LTMAPVSGVLSVKLRLFFVYASAIQAWEEWDPPTFQPDPNWIKLNFWGIELNFLLHSL